MTDWASVAFGWQALAASKAGKLVVTDGPFVESKEYVGGFWVLECASEEEALEWGRKAAEACRAPVEVRPFYDAILRRQGAREPRSASDVPWRWISPSPEPASSPAPNGW